MENKNCIFCDLLKNKEAVVFENEKCFVVFDRYPSEFGHMLVISKAHYNDVIDADEGTVSNMFIEAKKLATIAKERLNASGMVISTNTGKEAGQIIFHFHIHVLPKYAKKKEGFVHHKELTTDEATKIRNILGL